MFERFEFQLQLASYAAKSQLKLELKTLELIFVRVEIFISRVIGIV